MQPIIRLLGVSLLSLLVGAQSIAQISPDAVAQAFPNRPVRMIVPFPPGGPTDVMARVFGQKLSEEWGQPVVIENRAGGNSAIGAQQTARAAPDGYTLLVAMDTTLVMNPITANDLPYDPLKDLTPIGYFGSAPNILVVLFDDVGFSDLGCYGSPIATPTIDAIAARGLRYTGFHTTAMCSTTPRSPPPGRPPPPRGGARWRTTGRSRWRPRRRRRWRARRRRER